MNIPQIITENLPGPARIEITPDTELHDLGADELTIDSIALDLGNALGTDIPDEEARKWRTVADVVASVERRACV